MSEIVIKSAEFIKSVANVRDLPISGLPEIAFAGRSNSGKSTLINSLTMRRALAIASKTPGRTQLLNFFLLKFSDNSDNELNCHLVDLPGYGFAKVDGAKRKGWNKLIGEYLLTRENLDILVLSHDIRRDLQEEEFWFFEQFCNQPAEKKIVLLSLTKSDKLGANELSKRKKAISAQLSPLISDLLMLDLEEQTRTGGAGNLNSVIYVCGTDHKSKKGVESLRSAIFQILLHSAR